MYQVRKKRSDRASIGLYGGAMQNPSDDDIRRILTTNRTIAMVGASPNPARPSHGVMKFLLARGYRVTPVSPRVEGKDLLGQAGYGVMADVPEPFDMVDIFRQSEAAGDISDQALALAEAKGIKTVWMQLGVINEPAAERARAAGLEVVMDRCPIIEIRRLGIEPLDHAGGTP